LGNYSVTDGVDGPANGRYFNLGRAVAGMIDGLDESRLDESGDVFLQSVVIFGVDKEHTIGKAECRENRLDRPSALFSGRYDSI